MCRWLTNHDGRGDDDDPRDDTADPRLMVAD
jgi:hypothetical protein